ncbi:MAG: hypothetical protein IPL65_09635, partial [Lewinellaceae bacterium]|nr:hypothetical protein [Lewinellaceae bacterium]
MASKKTKQKQSTTANTVTPGFWTNPLSKYAILIVVLTFVVFGNSIKNGYSYDDKPFIAQNYLVKQGFKGIPTLLVTDFWAGYTSMSQANPSYRPLPLVSLAIEHQIWGLSPGVNHFVNVLLYGFICVLIFYLFNLLFKERYPKLALLIALLFCVHPIHTEVVANVKGRDDLFALFNGLMALYLLMRYVAEQKRKQMGGALLFYLLALLSKEHIITWVGIVPLTLYFFSSLPWKKIVAYASPFWGVSVLYFILRSSILGTGIVQRTDYIDNPILSATNAADMWATKIAMLGMFIKKLLLPYPLSSDYSYQA